MKGETLVNKLKADGLIADPNRKPIDIEKIPIFIHHFYNTRGYCKHYSEKGSRTTRCKVRMESIRLKPGFHYAVSGLITKEQYLKHEIKWILDNRFNGRIRNLAAIKIGRLDGVKCKETPSLPRMYALGINIIATPTPSRETYMIMMGNYYINAKGEISRSIDHRDVVDYDGLAELAAMGE